MLVRPNLLPCKLAYWSRFTRYKFFERDDGDDNDGNTM